MALRGADGTHKVIVEGGGYPRYLDGYLVYARAEGLMAARFDERAGRIEGQPASIIDGVITNFSGGAHFDVSPNAPCDAGPPMSRAISAHVARETRTFKRRESLPSGSSGKSS